MQASLAVIGFVCSIVALADWRKILVGDRRHFVRIGDSCHADFDFSGQQTTPGAGPRL